MVQFSEAIVVTPDQRYTVPELAQVVLSLLRQGGWSIVPVDMARIHLPLGAKPHPLYKLTKNGLHGAANILEYPQGAEALIFLNTPCFDTDTAPGVIGSK
jgi:hypothetical protein